jgi:hypothetical protein
MASPKKKKANPQPKYIHVFVPLKNTRSEDRQSLTSTVHIIEFTLSNEFPGIKMSLTGRSIRRLPAVMKFTAHHRGERDETQQKLHTGNFTNPYADMNWYNAWLSRQLENLPYCLRELRVGGEKVQSKQSLVPLFGLIEKFARENDGVSIDDILKHLRDCGLFDSSAELMGAQRLLIFATLGWQSMLYQAAFNVCSVQELAIHIDSHQPQSGLVFDTYRVAADLSDRPLSVLLKAFGNLLPARTSGTAQLASETGKMAFNWHPLYPNEINAFLLHVLLHVNIQWVNSLSLHLDYDKSSKTLSLFGYPSFCLQMLHNRGVIFSFASVEGPCADPRANNDDISQYLKEVLLTYRLLFGQSAASRKFFRRTFNPLEVQGSQLDTLLPQLCAKSRLDWPSGCIPVDRSVYFSARDFPVLCERIELIASELKDTRPNSLSGLLRDRRDTLQYWTFWLVSIIGGVSILLSLIQVILQGIQLAQS